MKLYRIKVLVADVGNYHIGYFDNVENCKKYYCKVKANYGDDERIVGLIQDYDDFVGQYTDFALI